MKHLVIFSVLMVLCFSCGSNKEFSAQDHQAYQELQELVASKSFEIVSTSAMPRASVAFSKVANSNILGPGNNAGHIDISANGNIVVVKGDSIRGNLPFFGERNFGGSYGSNHTGIEFNGIPKNYKVTQNNKKHTIEITFNISDEYQRNERYDMTITLYPNYKSNIRVQSTSRSSIEFSGRVSRLQTDKE